MNSPVDEYCTEVFHVVRMKLFSTVTDYYYFPPSWLSEMRTAEDML